MQTCLRFILLAFCLAGFGGCTATTPSPSAAASHVTDLQGQPANPLAALPTQKATVLLFVTNDCPISNAYAPEIHRLCDAFMKQGIAFYLVYSDADLSAVDIQKHFKEFDYRCPAVRDPAHELARKSGVTITPEAAVFLPDGKIVYRGRINDLYLDYGKARFAPTTNDLKDVLQQIAQGNPPAPRTTTAIGCYIPL